MGHRFPILRNEKDDRRLASQITEATLCSWKVVCEPHIKGISGNVPNIDPYYRRSCNKLCTSYPSRRVCNHGIFSSQCSWKQRSRLSSYFLLSALVATFSCFRFTPGLAFGEKDIVHPAITEYLSLTGQGKLQNRKIISERKQTVYGNSLPVLRTDKESIFVSQSNKTDTFHEL